MFSKESVKERREFNRELYEKLFKKTGKPKKILDLGSGLSPIYFPYKDVYYIAVDIEEASLRKVKKYFKKNKIKGEAVLINLKKEIPNIKADIAFLFKILDQLTRKRTEEILLNLKTEYIIASFPTKTISGKRMNKPKRNWFEKMLKKLNYKYELLRYFNEIFYIIKK